MTSDENAGAKGKCANCGGKFYIPQDPAAEEMPAAVEGASANAAAPAPAAPAAAGRTRARRAGAITEPATLRLTWGRVIGSLEKLDVLVDGASVGSVRPGREFEAAIAPGPHRLAVISPNRQCSKDFVARPLCTNEWKLEYGLAQLRILPPWQEPPARRPVMGMVGGFLAGVGGLALAAGVFGDYLIRAVSSEDLALPGMPVATSLCFVLGGTIFVAGGLIGVLSRLRSRYALNEQTA